MKSKQMGPSPLAKAVLEVGRERMDAAAFAAGPSDSGPYSESSTCRRWNWPDETTTGMRSGSWSA